MSIKPKIALKTGIKYAYNELLKQISSFSGLHLYYPSSLINAQVTVRCNLRCEQCASWKMKPAEELSTAQWKEIMLDIRKYIGPFYFRFYGGEPFCRNDILELIDFASRNDICPLITTNATFIDKEVARELEKSKVGLVNVSLDGIRPETHDNLRGVDGVYRKVIDAIGFLKGRVPIKINTTILNENLDEIPELADFALKQDLQIYFQGLVNVESEEKGHEYKFQITDHRLFPEDTEKVNYIIDELIGRKKNNRAIVNSREQLERLKMYYNHSSLLENEKCGAVYYNHLVIKANGNLQICSIYGTIGNLEEQSLRQIWCSQETRQTIKEMKKCKIRNCVVVCGYHKESYTEIARKVIRSLTNG